MDFSPLFLAKFIGTYRLVLRDLGGTEDRTEGKMVKENYAWRENVTRGVEKREGVEERQ